LCESVARTIGPLVWLRQRAERPWRMRLAQSLRASWQRIARRDDPLPKVVLAVGLAALLAAALIPVTYRVGAPARIEGAVQRVVAAPFDGFLQRSHVRPGDAVRAGDLLVELADQDLALEQRKWESTLTQQENAYAAALARADRAQFVISHGKADEARAQLDLVRQQLSRTRLMAPIDGVVIKGDLSQALGSPVQRGDALLTLAPREQYRLIVEVDERDIGDVKPGQSGHLALASLPSDPLALVVERVTPVSNVRDGRNVFDVEARLTGAALDLRPGLQGVAKIDAGEQSIVWIWTHRITDWLRLAWWSWGP
jgi:multidrug resistance efflux pump